jgi:quinolinate synthase
MKKIKPADLLRALDREEHEIVLPPGVMEDARRAIERMLAAGV